MTQDTRRIVAVIQSIPRGKAACYRDIALAAGFPNGARQVARLLHSMSEKYRLPWHRVVKADGFIALPPDRGGSLQAGLLRSEGVEVSAAMKIDLKKYNALGPVLNKRGNISQVSGLLGIRPHGE
jgi:methylated-DNA-protein-cysteine methyltransferase-like protein